jgi:3-oxoacyl-[acyl-carrier protein] reductase
MDDARTIVVTGTSRGIGRMLAEHYVAAGDLVIGCSRGEVDHPPSGSGSYEHHVCDLGDELAVRHMFSAIRKAHGAPSLVVGNAGAFSADLALLATAANVSKVLQQNVVGGFVVAREAAKLMRPAGFGRIVTISSIAVPIVAMGNAFYAASKVALEKITEVMALELADSGITLNTIGVSFVEGSGMYEQAKPESLDGYRARLRVARAISIEELVHAVEFFADPLAGAVTAQTVYFGGPF